MTDVQSALYSASVAKMRSQITGKAAAAAADRSNKGVEKFLRTLGAKKISHMFTHLRKIAQHPLLVRSNYSDDQVALIARVAYERWGLVGWGAGLWAMPRAEVCPARQAGAAQCPVSARSSTAPSTPPAFCAPSVPPQAAVWRRRHREACA